MVRLLLAEGLASMKSDYIIRNVMHVIVFSLVNVVNIYLSQRINFTQDS